MPRMMMMAQNRIPRLNLGAVSVSSIMVCSCPSFDEPGLSASLGVLDADCSWMCPGSLLPALSFLRNISADDMSLALDFFSLAESRVNPSRQEAPKIIARRLTFRV